MEQVSDVKYFDDRFENANSQVALLPLFHSCDAITFRSILETRRLIPTDCSVFVGEKLIYMFYGRPAYKKRSVETDGLNSYLPISFILDWNHIPEVKRVAPFDTGAFESELYKRYMHPKMKVQDFFMRPEKRSTTKTTSFFFGGNKDYFKGTPKAVINYDHFDFEIESYLKLIKGRITEPADDRKATIEIQLETEIVLSKDTLKAVILPSDFACSDIVKRILVDELSVQLIEYKSYGVHSAYYYTHTLYLANNFLLDNKYFTS